MVISWMERISTWALPHGWSHSWTLLQHGTNPCTSGSLRRRSKARRACPWSSSTIKEWPSSSPQHGHPRVTQSEFVMFPHHDYCRMCTYIIGMSGAKVWCVMCPKHDSCPKDIEGLSNVFHTAMDMSPEGTFSSADLATIILEAGDIMWVQHSFFLWGY